uniref:THAP-type domain-containing protein n=1 Tax=Sipha flava TaxID=143950 RepID=A0A2S2QR85_9HEMI
MQLYLPSDKICDDHFLPENYLPSGYLKNNAVPFLASISTNIEPLDHTYSDSPSHMKRLCAEPIVYTNTDVKPLDYHGTSSLCQSPIKRKVLNANSIGVLSPSHFRTPRKAKRHLDMVKNKYREKQIQNENLKKQIKRLKKKLNTYDDLVQTLHRKQFLTDNASVHLQVNYQSCKRYF